LQAVTFISSDHEKEQDLNLLH